MPRASEAYVICDNRRERFIIKLLQGAQQVWVSRGKHELIPIHEDHPIDLAQVVVARVLPRRQLNSVHSIGYYNDFDIQLVLQVPQDF
jgi:hypothetical protein